MPQQIVGPLTYIDVRGQDSATAETNLQTAGILYEFAANGVYSSQYAQGEIAVQDPDPDVTTEIAVDSAVTLTVSLGVQVGQGDALGFGFGLGFHRAAAGSGSPDATPDQFLFVDQTGVALSSTITSAPITVSGVSTPVSISIVGGTYDINGSGSFTGSAGTVSNGDTVRARVSSSGSNSTPVSAPVTIGGVIGTFTATTLASSTLYPDFPYDDTRSIVSGAYHVDPVSGNDSHNGILVSDGGTGPKLTINAIFASMGPDKTCYLRAGTHVVSSINNKFIGASGTAGHPAVFTSYPGEEPIIDCNGATWVHLERSYYEFRHLKVQNYTQCWTVAEDNTCTAVKFFCIEGTTPLGGDNAGLIHVWEATRAPNIVMDRIRITFTGGAVHLNTGGIYFKRTSASIATLDHLEIYGFPMSIYHKHGESSPSVNGNATCSNSIFTGQTRANASYNPSGWLYTNCIFGDGAVVQLSESDGGPAGDLNRYNHCTFYESLNLTNQSGGALNDRLTNCVLTSLSLSSPSTIDAASDYNLFPAGTPISRYGVSQNLVAWRAANSSDAHSVQGNPVYVGSDFSTIAAYALQSGSPGENAASDGADMGVDVTTVGVHAP